jgi:diguanylate cyclase
LALEQSQDVKAKVEACADDIGNANGLVKATIATGGTTLPAHTALEAGLEVESKVHECADDLREVAETLVKGIEELRSTEAELVAAKTALAKTETALGIAQEGEKEAKLQALHDPTTGLPNREPFNTRLEQAISFIKRHGGTLAVMFFDLDRFKTINDTHGHAAGDAVLQEVARSYAIEAFRCMLTQLSKTQRVWQRRRPNSREQLPAGLGAGCVDSR